MSDDLLTQEQVAEYFGVSPETIRKWRRSGRISFIRIHNTVRFERKAVEQCLDLHRVEKTCA